MTFGQSAVRAGVCVVPVPGHWAFSHVAQLHAIVSTEIEMMQCSKYMLQQSRCCLPTPSRRDELLVIVPCETLPATQSCYDLHRRHGVESVDPSTRIVD